MTLFIGLGHYKRTGKDSFANYLIDELTDLNPRLKVLKRSFAWKLKQVCQRTICVGRTYPGCGFLRDQGREVLREVVLPQLGRSPRQIWIDFGTKAVRDQVYHHTWRDFLFKDKSTPTNTK